MGPKRPSMQKNHRLAYHESGHAVLAARFGIGIERVAIKRLPGRLTCSIYQSAIDYCPLRVGRVPDPLVELRLEKYMDFLHAGSAADMLALEQYHGYSQEVQKRFRQDWFERMWARPEIHLDLAYYHATVWNWDNSASPGAGSCRIGKAPFPGSNRAKSGKPLNMSQNVFWRAKF